MKNNNHKLKNDVGLTKSYIKRVGVMPAKGAEAVFSCATGTMN